MNFVHTSRRLHWTSSLASVAAVALSALVVGGAAATRRADTALNSMLTPYLAGYELPAVAAAVVRGGQVVAAGAVGTRRAGYSIPVTVADRFHSGSDTKAMTARLAGILVEEGKLRRAQR